MTQPLCTIKNLPWFSSYISCSSWAISFVSVLVKYWQIRGWSGLHSLILGPKKQMIIITMTSVVEHHLRVYEKLTDLKKYECMYLGMEECRSNKNWAYFLKINFFNLWWTSAVIFFCMDKKLVRIQILKILGSNCFKIRQVSNTDNTIFWGCHSSISTNSKYFI